MKLGKVFASFLVIALLLGMLSVVQTAEAAPVVIGFEDFDGGAINLSGTANVFDYGAGGGALGDVFGRVDGQLGGTGMPFDVADDTVVDVSGARTGSAFPSDTLGLAGQNTTAFFAMNDMDAVAVNNAIWTFDISSASSVGDITIDIGALGDFEASSSDGFKIEARIDSGSYQTIFEATTDESSFKTYRALDNGFVFEDDDPLQLFIDGSGTPVGFLDKSDPATGNFDTYTSTLLAGQSGGTLDVRVSWTGTPSGSEPMGIDNITVYEGDGGGASDPVINEFVFNHTGSDTQAFIEVFGEPSTDYSGLTVLEVEGDSSGAGTIDAVLPVGSTDANGFWTDDEDAENGSVTLLLVEGFSGAFGDDLDADNDGVLDSTPWTRVVDDVAVSDGGSSDHTYAGTTLNPGFDGISFSVGGASRIPNGTDTDTTGDWVRNDFDGYGFPGFTGSQQIGEAINTPGAVNEVITVIVDPFGVCGDPATRIHDIQGSGLTSADVGNVRAVEAVVVATFYGPDEIGGYFLQEEDADVDTDPMTSEGLRVFDTTNTPGVGDLVRIRGSVAEFFDLTELTNVTDFADCGTGVATAAELSLPVSSIDDFEAYEGMLVTIPQTLYIAEFFNFDRFGEIVLTTDRQFQPTATYDPGSPEAAALALANSLSRITLDDGRGNQNPDPAIHPNGLEFTLDNRFRGGDTVANVTGVMDYNFGAYKIQPTQGADYSSENPRTAEPEDVGGNLKVAAFNVLNYFTTLDDGSCPYSGGCRGADNTTEFTRQRDKIIAAIAAIDADVVGLIEIENHPGDVPTADLVSGLNDVMGAGTYDYVATGALGTDAIRQAFIYKPATVSLVGDYAALDTPAFLDPNNLGDDKNRPALAQTFLNNTTGGVFTAVVNHLKSKGSPCGPGDDDPMAASCNLTRTLAAQELVDWLATDPTGSADEDFLIIGDLNSYDKEDPIDVLVAGGYTDLLFEYIGENAYSYVFDGQLGYLDYALANAASLDEVTGVTVWHNNTDEPDLIDYDTSFKKDAQDAIYAPDAYRSSDHDPVIVGLELTTAAEVHELIEDVQELVDEGMLNHGQGNALISKLENVLAKLAKGNTNAAANQLDAFINQVEDFVSDGILTAEQGDPLIKSAVLLVEVLSK